ncbi:MAG: nucleotidyltransferase family protein [Clostridiales bacterium]|nr:nucleotidyltransferase family protein [Clostridiales bacterium]
MKCIILAAGYATRLYPLTENFPKPLLPVGGKPILNWLTEDISEYVDEFIVVTNHKFAHHFFAWAEKRPHVSIVDDGTETNETRLGAVKDIQLAMEGVTGDVFVIAGDNVLTFSMVPFLEFARQKGTSCVMCHEENRLEKQQRTAIITVYKDNRITSYEEKPKTPKGNLAVPPFYYYRSQDIKRIGEALEDGCGYDAPGSFAAWLSMKTPMYAWRMPGDRYDVGDMKSYQYIRDTYKGFVK